MSMGTVSMPWAMAASCLASSSLCSRQSPQKKRPPTITPSTMISPNNFFTLNSKLYTPSSSSPDVGGRLPDVSSSESGLMPTVPKLLTVTTMGMYSSVCG